MAEMSVQEVLAFTDSDWGEKSKMEATGNK